MAVSVLSKESEVRDRNFGVKDVRGEPGFRDADDRGGVDRTKE